MQRLGTGITQCIWTCITAVLLIALLSSCNDGKGDPVEPTSAIFTGKVTIENLDLWREWQDSGDVQLNVFPEFTLNPPAGWGTVPDGTFGPGFIGGTFAIGPAVASPVIFNYTEGQVEYGYTFTLTNMQGPATFSAIAVGFVHDSISDTQRRTAPLGVFWNNPDSVSHGIVIRPAIGADPIFNYPAPVTFTVNPGDFLEMDFKADFGFVEQWY